MCEWALDTFKDAQLDKIRADLWLQKRMSELADAVFFEEKWDFTTLGSSRSSSVVYDDEVLYALIRSGGDYDREWKRCSVPTKYAFLPKCEWDIYVANALTKRKRDI